MGRLGTIGRSYSRRIRQGLGRFANWPIQAPVVLGAIGTYHGRTASFSWDTSLSEFGVNVEPETGKVPLNELFTSNGQVDVSFGSDALATARACFRFTKAMAVAAQGYETTYARLPLERLLQEIRNVIHLKGEEWITKRVIVTEVWSARSFTALVSGGAKARARISGSVAPPVDQTFNVADINLNLRFSGGQRMAYNAVAEPEVVPFFDIHRVICRAGKCHLKLYGRDNWLFG